MNSRQDITLIQADGWYKVGQKGSHVQFKHPLKQGRVTVPHPKRDMAFGTLKSIETKSGVKLERP